MFQNWLNPSTIKEEMSFSSLPSAAIANHIDIYQANNQFPLLENVQIVLIGLDALQADAIRKQLYALSFNFGKLKLADLGNLKKTTASFIIPILKELHDTNILPILIGGDTKAIYAQYQAHYAKRQLTNVVIVDERIHFDLDEERNKDLYLTKILNHRKLFHLGVLACQSHFVPLAIQKYFNNRYLDLLYLGNLRSKIDEVEPLLRDADLMAFNISALRQSDAPGQKNPSPSGLFGEEACQISRYAGMSDKLSSVAFYGFDTEKDKDNQSSQLVAQLVWYFMDGFFNRKHDFPKSTDNLVEYIVDQKELDHQITFWKSNKSGRWWMQIPIKTAKKHDRHKLIPCSYQDYVIASQGKLPARLMSAYHRFL